MILNIYNKKKIVKTYTAEAYDLPFGMLEDIAGKIDIDAIEGGDKVEMLKFIAKFTFGNIDTVKKLMKDIFDGLTDEELRHAHVPDMAAVMLDVVSYTLGAISGGSKSKNR